jgi:prepilin peptidase CpaA
MPELLNALLLVVVICAAIYDLRVRRIPNWLTAPAAVTGIALNAVMLPHGGLLSLAGLACALAVYLPLYVVRGMGAGDVKLMAAVGAIAGPSNWILIFIATALIAGAASLLLIAVRRRVRETSHNLAAIVTALLERRAPAADDPKLDVRHPGALRMPHGAFIASGAMLFLILSRAR